MSARVRVAKRNIGEVLREAEQRLQTARFGLEDMRDHPHRGRAGLANVIVFGRAVTFALQHLKSIAEGFSEWYETKRVEMREDPVMSYFYSLRNGVEKEAKPVPMNLGFTVHELQYPRDFGSPPPGAQGFFIGDQDGCSGWYVTNPAGRQEKYYISIPPSSMTSRTTLEGAPLIPGKPDIDAVELAAMYLNGLELMLREAREKFAPHA